MRMESTLTSTSSSLNSGSGQVEAGTPAASAHPTPSPSASASICGLGLNWILKVTLRLMASATSFSTLASSFRTRFSTSPSSASLSVVLHPAAVLSMSALKTWSGTRMKYSKVTTTALRRGVHYPCRPHLFSQFPKHFLDADLC